MSDSIAKYEELSQERTFNHNPANQRSTQILIDILQATQKSNLLDVLLEKAITISRDAPNLPPLSVFQIAAEEAKIDELCN